MQVSAPITTVNTLAERVAWAREKAGLSQQELADKAGVSQGTIGNVESGARKRPRDLLEIARALRVSPDWLSSGKGEAEFRDADSALPLSDSRSVISADRLTPVPFTTPPLLTWEELQKMAQLPPMFVIAMPDGSLTGHIEKGASLIFATDLEPKPGKTVLVADATGNLSVRVYTVVAGNHWQAHAKAPGYLALDSETHGLRILATLKWRED